MTDQQTSRMNITEALDRLLAILPTGDSPLPSQRLVKTWVPDVAEAADAVRDILANPRSDAVTARDEPSTVEALKRDHPERLALADALGDMLQYEYPDKYAMGFALLSRLAAQGVVVREARAASASVPPLHTDDAGSPLGSTTEGTSFGPKPAGDVSGELGLRDASLASAIVTESVTSTVPPLDVERLARAMNAVGLGMPYHDADPVSAEDAGRVLAAYAAETPKQGRGDESR